MAGEGTLTERRVVRRMCEMCESTYSEEGSVVMDTSREERPRKMRGELEELYGTRLRGEKRGTEGTQPAQQGGN